MAHNDVCDYSRSIRDDGQDHYRSLRGVTRRGNLIVNPSNQDCFAYGSQRRAWLIEAEQQRRARLCQISQQRWVAIIPDKSLRGAARRSNLIVNPSNKIATPSARNDVCD